MLSPCDSSPSHAANITAGHECDGEVCTQLVQWPQASITCRPQAPHCHLQMFESIVQFVSAITRCCCISVHSCNGNVGRHVHCTSCRRLTMRIIRVTVDQIVKQALALSTGVLIVSAHQASLRFMSALVTSVPSSGCSRLVTEGSG